MTLIELHLDMTLVELRLRGTGQDRLGESTVADGPAASGVLRGANEVGAKGEGSPVAGNGQAR